MSSVPDGMISETSIDDLIASLLIFLISFFNGLHLFFNLNSPSRLVYGLTADVRKPSTTYFVV